MLIAMHTCSFAVSGTYRYEQYTPKQSPGQCCFNNLFVTFGAGAVAPQQRCDVERHLCDGAKCCIYHRSHCKVTLCRNAGGIRTITDTTEEIRRNLLHPSFIFICGQEQK